jgi:hypothetical protein
MIFFLSEYFSIVRVAQALEAFRSATGLNIFFILLALTTVYIWTDLHYNVGDHNN